MVLVTTLAHASVGMARNATKVWPIERASAAEDAPPGANNHQTNTRDVHGRLHYNPVP